MGRGGFGQNPQGDRSSTLPPHTHSLCSWQHVCTTTSCVKLVSFVHVVTVLAGPLWAVSGSLRGERVCN